MFKFFKNNLLNIHLRKLSDSNQAVVGIVVAVLLIGLVVSVISVIQLVYVPNWMEETESEHIDEVFNQFCQLKLVIDTQSANKKNFTPIVTSINLGTNKIPFFMSTRAAGGLDIIDNACNVTIKDTHGGTYGPYSLGAIKFTSANAYYIPNELISFIYENGALITNQKGGNALNIKPSFAFAYEDGNETVYFNMVDISSVGGKISKYGYDIEHIRTEYYLSEYHLLSGNPIFIPNVDYLEITSNYTDIWYSFISGYLNSKGVICMPPEYPSVNTVHIEFNKAINFELSITGIYAQIGPGWIDIS